MYVSYVYIYVYIYMYINTGSMALVNMPDNKCPVTAHINMTSVTQPVEIEKPLHWTYEGETGKK